MNNRNQEKHFIVDILFVLALFGVFAVSALALVTIGADVYQHTVEDMGVNYESRTAVSYILEKVRQNDTTDSISLATLEDTPALCMLSRIEDETYCTYLYFYDGHLKELFMREGTSLGGQVLPAGTDISKLRPLMELAVDSKNATFSKDPDTDWDFATPADNKVKFQVISRTGSAKWHAVTVVVSESM